MLFQPDDRVEVRKSNSGFTGPGQIVDVAFGINYLVRVEREGRTTVILVRATWMVHAKGGARGSGGDGKRPTQVAKDRK